MNLTQNQVDPSKTLKIRQTFTNKQRRLFAAAAANTPPDNPNQNEIDNYLAALLALLMMPLVNGSLTYPYVSAAYLRGITNANIDLRAGGIAVTGAETAVLTQAVHRFSLQAKQDQTHAIMRKIYVDTVGMVGTELQAGNGEDEIKKQLRKGMNLAITVGGTALVGIVADAFLNRVVDFGIALVSPIVETRFTTMGDDRVCFPKWTLVRTDCGDIPIQDIKPGMKVLTRKGYRPVAAISKRPYSGEMSRINTEIGSVYSTSDHPYWVNGKGWIEGRNLSTGLKLQSFNNKPIKVGRVVNFFLADSHNNQSLFSKEVCFSGVPLLVSVPVSTVNLQGDVLAFQQEVNGISSGFSLLNIFNSQFIKTFTNGFFNRCFTSEFAINRKRNKTFCFLSWLAGF